LHVRERLCSVSVSERLAAPTRPTRPRTRTQLRFLRALSALLTPCRTAPIPKHQPPALTPAFARLQSCCPRRKFLCLSSQSVFTHRTRSAGQRRRFAGGALLVVVEQQTPPPCARARADYSCAVGGGHTHVRVRPLPRTPSRTVPRGSLLDAVDGGRQRAVPRRVRGIKRRVRRAPPPPPRAAVRGPLAWRRRPGQSPAPRAPPQAAGRRD